MTVCSTSNLQPFDQPPSRNGSVDKSGSFCFRCKVKEQRELCSTQSTKKRKPQKERERERERERHPIQALHPSPRYQVSFPDAGRISIVPFCTALLSDPVSSSAPFAKPGYGLWSGGISRLDNQQRRRKVKPVKTLPLSTHVVAISWFFWTCDLCNA